MPNTEVESKNFSKEEKSYNIANCCSVQIEWRWSRITITSTKKLNKITNKQKKNKQKKLWSFMIRFMKFMRFWRWRFSLLQFTNKSIVICQTSVKIEWIWRFALHRKFIYFFHFIFWFFFFFFWMEVGDYTRFNLIFEIERC